MDSCSYKTSESEPSLTFSSIAQPQSLSSSVPHKIIVLPTSFDTHRSVTCWLLLDATFRPYELFVLLQPLEGPAMALWLRWPKEDTNHYVKLDLLPLGIFGQQKLEWSTELGTEEEGTVQPPAALWAGILESCWCLAESRWSQNYQSGKQVDAEWGSDSVVELGPQPDTAFSFSPVPKEASRMLCTPFPEILCSNLRESLSPFQVQCLDAQILP